ncbi:ogr/Delta-like zinc finger family protein [Novosphingobium sediminicola]|uniref:Zinc finger Ogr/Delta-type domain-containing protein n=1 Tax=Novosphingobium sediminicola TaxID=563162 RepID=A0A7W6CGN9_9SPHN|nr:ogr/Delta-like zinc finger family protein [Novosphingobium sediminicola]MBB3953420.1 hypothetical protein [Novosphingobium sediminicola]
MSGEGALGHRPLVYAPLEFRLRSGGGQAKGKAFITCPKCDAPMFIRRSERQTETVKHIDAHCTNTGCTMTGMFELVFVHFFNPGLLDRADLKLKACPRDQIPHVLPPPREEADDGQISMFDPS